MTTIELTIELPEDVAADAKRAGLLSGDVVAQLITQEVRQRRVAELFAAADRLADLDAPPLTEEEIAGSRR